MEYGIIDETTLSLKYPRLVDATRPTLQEAVEVALEWIKNGTEEVTVTLVRHSPYHGGMVEDGKRGYITLDATGVKPSFFS